MPPPQWRFGRPYNVNPAYYGDDSILSLEQQIAYKDAVDRANDLFDQYLDREQADKIYDNATREAKTHAAAEERRQQQQDLTPAQPIGQGTGTGTGSGTVPSFDPTSYLDRQHGYQYGDAPAYDFDFLADVHGLFKDETVDYITELGVQRVADYAHQENLLKQEALNRRDDYDAAQSKYEEDLQLINLREARQHDIKEVEAQTYADRLLIQEKTRAKLALDARQEGITLFTTIFDKLDQSRKRDYSQALLASAASGGFAQDVDASTSTQILQQIAGGTLAPYYLRGFHDPISRFDKTISDLESKAPDAYDYRDVEYSTARYGDALFENAPKIRQEEAPETKSEPVVPSEPDVPLIEGPVEQTPLLPSEPTPQEPPPSQDQPSYFFVGDPADHVSFIDHIAENAPVAHYTGGIQPSDVSAEHISQGLIPQARQEQENRQEANLRNVEELLHYAADDDTERLNIELGRLQRDLGRTTDHARAAEIQQSITDIKNKLATATATGGAGGDSGSG